MSSIVDVSVTSTAMSPDSRSSTTSTSASGIADLDVALLAGLAQQLGGVDEQGGATHASLSDPGRRSPSSGRPRRPRRRAAAGTDPIDSRWRPAPTVFCSLSSRISKLPRRWSRKSSVSWRSRRASASAVSITWRARCSAARTTSVRCTIRSARTRAASSSSSASRRVLATNSWRSLSIQRAWRSSSGSRCSASSSSSMISSRSMRGDDDSGIVGAVAMMSIERRSSVSASPT